VSREPLKKTPELAVTAVEVINFHLSWCRHGMIVYMKIVASNQFSVVSRQLSVEIAPNILSPSCPKNKI
jgi:hypothetical protein